MDNKDLELYNRRKQTVYEFICDDDYPPMKFKEMCTFLQVPGDERQTFLDILNDQVLTMSTPVILLSYLSE